MVVLPNPRSRSDHDYMNDHEGDDSPSKHDSRGVVVDMMLEGADNLEEEPGYTGDGTAGVDATNVLNETSEENSPPNGGPLKRNR